jgi:hypothetical protein
MVQTPPPSITPRQMNLLRVVTALAWSDGGLAEEEVSVMLDRFSQMFAAPAQQARLRQELQDYLMQNIPLEELTPKLQSQDEKELVLRLGYEVISASARVPEESPINANEAAAYQNLVALLDLPAETVAKVEAANSSSQESLVDRLVHQVRDFMR